jgi:HlyD family secretion protein
LKTRKILVRVGLLAVVVGGIVYFAYIKPKLAARKIEYTFTSLEKGDIESTISSTGTLEAINTIQVGTQISGTIGKIYADYNDHVQAGQLLADIDTRLLNASLANAQANLSVVNTRLSQAEEEFKRNKALFEKRVITEKEYKDSQYVYEQSLSNKKAAEASVKSAEVNLGYAHIKSPIAGTITERSIEEGQTVAASFATPTLFIIAEDLSKMQILAEVDESDIGYIQQGMAVRFAVQTYPGKKFYGDVSQIRLQPAKINNVVNYKVVIDVSNEKGLLLPGMTASVDFISESARNVLLVNNSALRFRPTESMAKQVKPLLKQKAASLPDSIRASFLASLENEDAFTNGGFRKILPPKINGVFYQAGENKVAFDFVRLGITTGLQSEITSFMDGASLPPGAKIINGVKSKEK